MCHVFGENEEPVPKRQTIPSNGKCAEGRETDAKSEVVLKQLLADAHIELAHTRAELSAMKARCASTEEQAQFEGKGKSNAVLFVQSIAAVCATSDGEDQLESGATLLMLHIVAICVSFWPQSSPCVH